MASRQGDRLNPRNAICLCSLHDKLFDRGYFSLNSDYEITYTSKTDDMIKSLVENLKFKEPSTDSPSPELLEKHLSLFI